MTGKVNYRDRVAAELIESMENGTAPWQKPWEPNALRQAPFNPVSGKPYSGFNSIYLQNKGYEDPRWLTFKQAQSIDARVIKGEKSTQIEYWQWTERKPKLDAEGKPVLDDSGLKQYVELKLERPKVFYANVFNAAQVDGLAPLEKPELKFDPIESAEEILRQSTIRIYNDQSDRAFYSPSKDEIHLPPQEAFSEPYKYYATALHEVGHGTGHKERLNREFGPFGSETYAREELRAEIASFMMTTELGLGHYPERHANYLESWLKAIKDDKNEIFKAARDAEIAMKWVMQPELRENLQQTEQQRNTEERKVGKAPEKVNAATSVIYINVPFKEKDEARKLGARWDKSQGSWYIPKGEQQSKFTKWALAESLDQKDKDMTANRSKERAPADKPKITVLAVPFDEKDEAKRLGASWSRRNGYWYVKPNLDTKPFTKWLPENQKAKQARPEDEFAKVLSMEGMQLQGSPVFDGKWHRVHVDGDKPNSLNGSYRGFAEPIPTAQYINFKKHSEHQKWVQKGIYNQLSKIEIAQIKEDQKAKAKEREAEEQQRHKAVAKKAFGIWANAKDIPKSYKHPYLQKKGVDAAGLKISDRNQLIIPLKDKNGFLWNLQYINEDGSKFYMKGSRMAGLSTMIDPNMSLKDPAKPIFVCEGWSTAKTIQEATDCPTVSTTVAGNLETVVKELRAQFPNREIITASDDDHALTQRTPPLPNKGLEAGRKAAEAGETLLISPPFNDREKAEGLSDYNDLKNSRGHEELIAVLRDQVKEGRAIKQAETASLSQSRNPTATYGMSL